MKTLNQFEGAKYLGYCDIKGHLFSIRESNNKYRIVSVEDDKVTILITYTVKERD